MATNLAASHVLIMVPKRDELRGAAAVFGFSEDHPHSLLEGKYEAWAFTVAGLACTAVLADGQGAATLALATRAALDVCDPAISICLGTAAGRQGKTDYLDVVIAGAVLDASEWRAEPGNLEPQWDNKFEPSVEMRHDTERFLRDQEWCVESSEVLQSALTKLKSGSVELSDWPRVHDGWVVTTGFLHQDPDLLDRIWALHARLRAVDMETAGFVKACTSDPRSRPWCVVRSIADFGTRDSKRDELRAAAAAASAAVCQSFISYGLRRAHPLLVHPKELGEPRLSADNFFSYLSMRPFIAQHLSTELGISLDVSALTTDLSVRDLDSLCYSTGLGKTEVRDALDRIRESYFTEKYIDYDDQADVRGLVGPSWADDVVMAYAFLGIDIANADVLYLGVSTGRDLPLVCPEFRSLIGVDLSSAMLKRAAEVEPRMTVARDSAEQLATIEDHSIDLYLSLRTYQSSLFDIPSAARQAFRVLRRGGGIVISIPGGYVDRDEASQLRYVPGLLIPGSTVVDPERPRRVAERVIHQLEHLTFERVGFHQRGTDLYVYARKPSGASIS